MTCPNCGQEFEGDRCPNCGRSSVNPDARAAAIGIFILLVLPSGYVGTCSAIQGVNMMNEGGPEGRVFGHMAIGVGGVAFLATVLLVLWAVREWKG